MIDFLTSFRTTQDMGGSGLILGRKYTVNQTGKLTRVLCGLILLVLKAIDGLL